MDKNFLDYYRANLNHVRALGAEFASEFPKIAARLDLTNLDCQDPYVERIIEGTAFLAARIEQKMDDGFPRMLESVLSSIAPHALFPIPSVGTVELFPDFTYKSIKTGALISKNDKFESNVYVSQTPCIFTPLWESYIYPFGISKTEYIIHGLDSYCPTAKDDVAALRLCFRTENGTAFKNIAPKFVDLFINMSDGDASELQRQLLTGVNKVYARLEDGRIVETDSLEISIPALEGENLFFKRGVDQLNGLGVLQEFIAHPCLFKFIRLQGLEKIFALTNALSMELIITFKRRMPNFAVSLNKNALKMWCIPVINLFHKRSNRERIEGNYEHHIVPERTAPFDYEVYYVNNVNFFNDNNELLFSAKPFYHVDVSLGKDNLEAYFTVHRRKRLINVNKNKSQKSLYVGNEAYISISGENWHLYRSNTTQFSADLLCSNGGLTMFVRSGSNLKISDNPAIPAASFVGTPDQPRGPLFSNGKQSSWEKLSHIMLNMSSILWKPGEVPVHILKRIISHYSCLNPEETVKITDGIKSIKTEPEMFRFIYKNCNIYFENGWRVIITLSENKFEGMGFFMFACVLRLLIESFTPLNSCVEVVVYTEERGFIAKWTTSKN